MVGESFFCPRLPREPALETLRRDKERQDQELTRLRDALAALKQDKETRRTALTEAEARLEAAEALCGQREREAAGWQQKFSGNRPVSNIPGQVHQD